MALPRSMRFRDRRHVRRALRRGRRFMTPLGSAAVAPIVDGESGRVLFVVSSRVARKSSERHQIKRRLDGWVLARGGVRRSDVVISVSPEAARATQKELERRAGETFAELSRRNV